jgi:hypothetical protein
MVKFHKELILHFFYRLFAKSSGLNKYVKDDRDFDLGIFGWGKTYQPKNKLVLISTRRIIDQQNYNICQWAATTTCKEAEEGVDLTERSIVCKGKQLGMISGNGFSNLDAGDKVLKDWGIVKDGQFDNNYCNGNWLNFVSPNTNGWPMNGIARLHKIASHWNVSKRGDILKLLDDGKLLKTAIDWYTGFNQGGGFGNRGFIMDRFIGYKVGGHAFACKGYILNFKGIGADNKVIQGVGGQNVYVFQNSYGPLWGATIEYKGIFHRGLFFAEMNFFEKYGWVFKATLDMPLDVAHFINDYNNMNVKAQGENTVWLILNGQKHKYLTTVSLAKSGKDPMIVDTNILNNTPLGDNIK